jgi:hypothetical protein
VADLQTQGISPPRRAVHEDDEDEVDQGDLVNPQPPTQEPEIWPSNTDAVQVFIAMQTQWRTGFAGRTGLDYGVLPQVLGWLQVPQAEHAQLWLDVQAMELAALKVWADQAERERQRQERAVSRSQRG